MVARPIFFATDLYADISQNAGDETEVISAEDLAELGEEFQIDGFVPATAAPTSPTQPTEQETEAPPPTSEPTEEPGDLPDWDGKERLNILLIGFDGGRQGRGDASFLTDTMITVSVDPTHRAARVHLAAAGHRLCAAAKGPG